MKIRTLIVDDEVLSRRGVEIRLRDEADFEILAQFLAVIGLCKDRDIPEIERNRVGPVVAHGTK